jgi:hypothetical protein
MAKDKKPSSTWTKPLLVQGWVSLAVWMTIGLLLEGLLGYKIPTYLNDPQRRELFRLAHAHGTLLAIVLILTALCVINFEIALSRAPRLALQIGATLMPLGFLLAGVWHTESDPGLAIWLVPIAALMIIFGAIAMAMACINQGEKK